MHNVVGNVFKAVLLSFLMMAIVGTAVNLYMAFNTIGKIDAVAEAMKSELSRNNSFLDASFEVNTAKGSMNYTKQLTEIMNTSYGDPSSNSGKQFILKRVLVVPSTELSNPSSDWETNTNYVLLDTELTGTNYASALDTATNCIPMDKKWVNMTTSQGGDYGEFMTIIMEWDVNVTIFSTASMDEISTGTDDGDKSIAIHKGVITAPLTLRYTVPCLRYMKGGS